MNTAFLEHSREDALRESEERFQSIFDNAPIGLALVDKDGCVLAANEADCRFLGYSRDELVGTHFRTFTYSEDLNADSELYDSLIRGERASYVIDKRYVRKDGEIVWGRLSASLIRDAEGRPKYAVILCEDITDRKRMEEQIKSLARFPSENPNPVLRLDKNGIVLAANEASKTLLPEWKAEVGQAAPKFWCDLVSEVLSTGVSKNIDVESDGKFYSFFVKPITEAGYVNLYGRDITERKKAHQELTESEERFRAILDGVNDGILVANVETRKFYLGNNAICGMLGYCPEDIKNLGLMDIHPNESLRYVTEQFDKLARREIEVATEIPVKRRDGSIFYADISSSFLTLAGRTYLVGVFRDITERKKSEEALRASELKYRALFENIPHGVYQNSPDGKILTANPALVRMLGYDSESELLAADLARDIYVNPEDRKTWVRRLEETGELRNVELVLKRKDGRELIALDSGHVVRDERGRVLYYAGTITDITERKRAERALRESEELYRHLIQRQGEGLAIVDLEERITFCNPRGDQIFGASPGGMVGRTMQEFTTPETFEFVKKQTEKRLAGEKGTYEIEILRPDGDKRHLIVTAAPWLDKDGHVIGSVGIFRDETDRKRAEAEIRRLNQLRETIIDNANVWLDVLDENANVVIWNKAAEVISGYSREEVVGHGKIWEWLYPDEAYRKYLTDLVAQVIKRGRVDEDFETRITRKDGEIRIISWNERNLLDDHGKPIGSIAVGRDVTERKRMEEEIQRASQFVETILENANVSFNVLDENANVVVWNKAAELMTGYTREEVLGHAKIWEWLYPDEEYRRSITKKVADVMRRGRFDEDIETRILRKDGQVRIISWNQRNLVDKHGVVKGSVTIGRDITERERMQNELERYSKRLEELVRERTEELRESEENYRSLVENIPDVAWTTDRDGRTVFVSPNVVKVTGRTPEEIYAAGGTLWLERMHPDDKERVREAYEALFVRNEPYDVEYRFQRKDGEWIWLHDRSVATYEKDGRRYADGLLSDITERKRMEEQVEEGMLKVRESEAKFRGLYESIRDGIMANDVSGRIFDCNRAFENMVGYSLDELRKMRYQDITPEQYRELEDRITREEMVRGGFSGYVEKEYIRKDGRKVPVEVAASVVRGTGGRPDMIWCIIRDITERKHMQEALMKSQRFATIGEVAAMVGHDLRNPLQVLTNALYLLEEGFKTQPSSQTVELLERNRPVLLETMEEQIGYMNKIVSDLQDYARPLKPELAPTNLRHLIDEILSAASVPKSIDMSVEIEENVQELNIDHGLMKRAFTNLVTNAVQAMPDRGRLTIRALKADGMALISIRDTGAGIPKENLDKLFTPMFSTKAKGQGFGLAACKRIVEAHNGKISLESAVGKGTTVFIKIPVTEVG